MKTVEQVGNEKLQITERFRILAESIDSVQAENRHLKQLLEANGIPFLRSRSRNHRQASFLGKVVTQSHPSLNSSAMTQSDSSDVYRSVTNGVQNLATNNGQADAVMAASVPMAQGSSSALQTSIYPPANTGAISVPPPSSNSLITSPQDFSPFNSTNLYGNGVTTQDFPPLPFKDPTDSTFINFVVE